VTLPDIDGLAERSPDILYRYRLHPTNGFDYVSPAATAVTGYTIEEHYADPELPLAIVHPDDRHVLEERAMLGPTPDPVVLRWIRKDGRITWLELHETGIYDRRGKLVAIEGVGRELGDTGRGTASTRVVGGLRIDFTNQSVHVDGQSVHLSPVELKLLALLTSQPGRVFTRDEVMRWLWQSPHTGGGHACETYVSTLRRKIERDPRSPERILTVRGRGYAYAAPVGRAEEPA
jgi:PAS domain S-box-containing protein